MALLQDALAELDPVGNRDQPRQRTDIGSGSAYTNSGAAGNRPMGGLWLSKKEANLSRSSLSMDRSSAVQVEIYPGNWQRASRVGKKEPARDNVVLEP